jgi:hypothetical protein
VTALRQGEAQAHLEHAHDDARDRVILLSLRDGSDSA